MNTHSHVAPEVSREAAERMTQMAVLNRVLLVGRTHHYANHDLIVAGDPLPVRLCRSQTREAAR
jgi:hypothetical protein